VDNVSLEYRTPERVVRATHQVSFEIDPADRFVLLGPSGCGKSTLLKAVAGFIGPRRRDPPAAGQPVERPGPDRIVVFQEFDQLPPWKTVKQNVMFPLLASRTLKRARPKRALHYLDKVGLAPLPMPIPHLSGGMKARVAIARALAMQPKILLMDEPFAALDALTRRKMQEELLLLWEEVRFTLLFVTHSIEEALVVGNRILLLSPHPGRVRAEVSHQYDLHSLGGVAFRPRRGAFIACCSMKRPKPNVSWASTISASLTEEPSHAPGSSQVTLEPLPACRWNANALAQRLWQQGWLRKGDPDRAGDPLGSGRPLPEQRPAAAELSADRPRSTTACSAASCWAKSAYRWWC
jgi:NitT/TauT family transport system ATP-binding protein